MCADWLMELKDSIDSYDGGNVANYLEKFFQLIVTLNTRYIYIVCVYIYSYNYIRIES